MADDKKVTFPTLRIVNSSMAGRHADVFLNDQNISQWLNAVTLHLDCEGVVTASLTYVIGSLDINLPAEILATMQPPDPSGLTDTTPLGSNSRQFALTNKEKAREAWKCSACWKFNAKEVEKCATCGAKKGSS